MANCNFWMNTDHPLPVERNALEQQAEALAVALANVHRAEFPTSRPDSLCWCPEEWHDYPAGQQPPHSWSCQSARDVLIAYRKDHPETQGENDGN